jgi:hypothetical protein
LTEGEKTSLAITVKQYCRLAQLQKAAAIKIDAHYQLFASYRFAMGNSHQTG